MPQYMLLLYAEEAEAARGWEELPVWERVLGGLREAGILVSNSALYPTESATTVRVRSDQVEVTDGPFAMTKETLAGYFLISCAHLDEALKVAASIPLARYGSIEIRPLMSYEQRPVPGPSRADIR